MALGIMPNKKPDRRMSSKAEKADESTSSPEQKKTGRPGLDYDPETADNICAEIAGSSKSLKTICSGNGMPGVTTVYRWLRENEDFAKNYARAKTEQAELLVEEMLQIADDGINDTQTGEGGEPITNTDVIQRSKLRVDTRKWLASKLLPKKYGDKLDVEHSGAVGITLEDFKKRMEEAAK